MATLRFSLDLEFDVPKHWTPEMRAVCERMIAARDELQGADFGGDLYDLADMATCLEGFVAVIRRARASRHNTG
jgi:hypothetical protein